MTSATRAAIKGAFLQRLEEHPIGDITVKDIVQDCGLNRNSFYYHFKDIPTLLEEIVAEQAAALLAAQGPRPSLPDFLDSLVSLALDHRQKLLHISQSTHWPLFAQHLLKLCRQVVESYATAAFGPSSLPPEDQEVLLRFYQTACFGQIIAWLSEGMREDLRPQLRRLCQLGTQTTAELFRQAALEHANAK